ncbi:MAG: carbon starvation protein A [Proteobacteria bacterium]|nr:carbon starvation protein A [Pseudomonadota bacterium]
MNVAVLLILALPLFYLGYAFYSKMIARLFDEDDNNKTPAVALKDNVDYVPTNPVVLFGHHFSSIAGGGPIIGPAVAVLFGYVPVWLWLVIGSIFIGAAHDLATLYASIREKGKSIAEIANSSLGRTGFFLFIAFTIIMLLTVTSAFLGLTATSLTSKVPLEFLNLDPSQTLLKTAVIDGIVNVQIGGIASMSVIVITFCSPFLGYLLYKREINPYFASLIAITIAIVSITIGLKYPVTLDPTHWMIIISIYTILAAGLPVWFVLQPRDFTNSFLLYGGICVLLVAGIIAGFKGATMQAPAWNLTEASAKIGPAWPFLFITVACGAISGFHCLVCGGTTSKQLRKESDGRRIAYGGMIIEGIFAMCVLIAIGSALGFAEYTNIVFPQTPGVRSNPILAFALSMGLLLHNSLGIQAAFGTIFGILLVEGFVVTTLDTAVRLNRYLLEELWQFIFKNVPGLFKTYIFNALICVIMMFVLAYYNAFLVIWPLFGSANQLLASLALIVISVWLIKRGKKALFSIIPAIFMMATTIYSLWRLLMDKYLPKENYMLITTDILLIVLAFGVIILSLKTIKKLKTA